MILALIQIWTWFRTHHVKWHRLLGKLYVVGSLVGGASAMYLGVTISYEGSSLPLFLLSSLWLFMTTAAWLSIKQKSSKMLVLEQCGHMIFLKE